MNEIKESRPGANRKDICDGGCGDAGAGDRRSTLESGKRRILDIKPARDDRGRK